MVAKVSTAVDKVRLDKFLWAVRLYKTRSLAAEACNKGKVFVNDICAKPSREIVEDDIIELHKDGFCKTVQVLAPLKNRVGAALVSDYIEDKTPAEEYQRMELVRSVRSEYRERGAGRPTKKERREIDRLKNTY